MEKAFFTVSQVNSYIRSILEEDVLLREIFISGEISNFKRHSSGHMYFSLKDQYASINCAMFRQNAIGLDFEPENGMKVMLFGRVSLYEKNGAYQVYVDIMQAAGKGELHIKFEALKHKLFNEGLFDETHKKEIPENLKRVALITSPTSAAVQDMIKMSRAVNSGVQLIIIPVLVQGEKAPSSIVQALTDANKWGKADLIILGRGGGSIEDLWAFNEENVARAIFKSKIPVISAIGHETDYTISDFVADLRAPTPTAAITMSFKSRKLMKADLNSLYHALNFFVYKKLKECRDEITYLDFKGFYNRLIQRKDSHRDYLRKLYKRLEIKSDYQVKSKALRLESTLSLMESLSPMNILKRGYSILYRDKKAISQASALKAGDAVEIMLSDGFVKAVIK